MRTPLAPQRLCEIWIGRAGSGKTHGCLEAVADALIRSPRGRPLLLLVPEQATAQIERRLATWPGIGAGFTRARVLAFARLERLALAAAAEPPPPTPGETGRILLLRRALRRRRDVLLALQGSADQDGMAEAVGRALTELARYGWSPHAIQAWLEPQAQADRLSSPLARKAADLALIWADYQEQLRQAGWQDQPVRHAAAVRAVARWDALAGCQAWIDGFSSFTVQEMELLEALLGQADGATLALCADPDGLDPAGGGPSGARRRVGPERLFDNALETLRQVEDLLGRLGWLARRVPLPRPGAPTRFAASPALAHLERHVLGRLVPRPFVADANAPVVDWAGAPPIELIEATDRRAEVQAVARRVVALCRRHGPPTPGAPPALPWRRVGVIARDLALYAPLIREVFAQFEIPYFLDRPREVTGHPLARLLPAALAVLRGNWAGRDVVHYLKTGLVRLDPPDAAPALENHILSHDPRRRGWQGLLANIPALVAAWKAAQAPLVALGKALRAGGNPARPFWDFLDRLGVAATMDDWIAQARAQGDEEQAQIEQAQIHEQAWSQVLGWLEDLGRVAEADPDAYAVPANKDAAWRDRLDELTALLGSALSATRARLIPPTLNQVTVGAIDRSRAPELDVAFVLGLNEGEFPRAWTPDPLLNDADREALTRDGGRRLGPDSSRLGLQERYFVYIALTRATRAIVLSRPLTDAAGKAAVAAAPFVTVAEAFPQAPRRLVGPDGHGDAPTLGLRPEEWNRRLAAATARLGTPERASELAALMAVGDPLNLPGIPPAMRAAMLSGRRDAWTPRLPGLDLAYSRAFLATRPALPVTAVETYGQCPFKFFARDMLRLRSRDRAGLTVQDLGTLRHHVLERLFRAFRDADGLRWGQIDLAAADRLIDAEMTAAKARQPYARALQAGQIQGLTMDLVARDLKRVTRVLKAAAARGDLRQVAAERRIDLALDRPAGDATPPSRDTLSSLETTKSIEPSALPRLVGMIDRIDVCEAPDGAATAVLFDYKSGRPKFNLTDFLSGIDMQLGAYALALNAGAISRGDDAPETVPFHVGGMFYWSLAMPFQLAALNENAEISDEDATYLESAIPSGLWVKDLHGQLDRQVVPGGPKSPVFGFKLKNDGDVNMSSAAPWPAEGFERLLLAERRLIAHALRAIAVGRIAPRPYRRGKTAKACDRCDYLAICRLKAWRGDPPERPLASVPTRKKALEWLAAQTDARDPFAWPAAPKSPEPPEPPKPEVAADA
jgi:ATP-dependent helicase/nuclease subunit B